MKPNRTVPGIALLALLAATWTFGCASEPGQADFGESLTPAAERSAYGELSYDEEGLPHGLPHFRRWSSRIAQGGSPEDEEAFANLARLGYRTVLSVDGARPQVELAERFGLRYVHVPIGYDGLEREQELQIVRAVSESDGPVYVHCHHGRHRGPAAALVAHMSIGGISNTEAIEDLRVSGCSPDYPGLYRSIETFRTPSDAELAGAGELVSAVLPEGLRATMSHIDERWDYVRASARSAWSVPAKYPDIDAAHEVAMIENALRDMLQHEAQTEARPEFLELARASQEAAADLEEALHAADAGRADAAYERLGQSCKSCHASFRN